MKWLNTRLGRLLRAMLLWVDPPQAPEWRATSDDPVDVATFALVRQWESVDASGEYKRHQVYAALIKAFPDRRKRDLAYAIERAVQARGD